MNKIQKWYDDVFGNRDGKFTAKDLPNHAVLIMAVVIDLVIAVAEWRVYSAGFELTGDPILAFGFVMVSSLPFYLGQLAFAYNRANRGQLVIAVLMMGMGLIVSAYYGFADYVLKTNSYVQVTLGVSSVDVDGLYQLAVGSTVALVLGGLLYVLIDDGFSNRLRSNRIQGRAKIASEEIDIKRKLLAEMTSLRADEEALKTQYPEDYEALSFQFKSDKNPTGGNTSKR